MEIEGISSEIESIGSNSPLGQGVVPPRDFTSAEERTDRVASATLTEIDVPHPMDRLEPARVTEDPNLSLEGLKAVLTYEKKAMGQIAGREEEINTRLTIIDQLLDLSSEITKLKDKDDINQLSEKAGLILADLKTKGIDLLGDSTKITKEQLIELKSAIGSHIDQSRTKVQQVFTSMQTLIQNMVSVNDSGKRMINELGQMLKTILRNMRP